MSIRKHGTSNDQRTEPETDPGSGQGIERTAAQSQEGLSRPIGEGLSDAERAEIIRGEG